MKAVPRTWDRDDPKGRTMWSRLGNREKWTVGIGLIALAQGFAGLALNVTSTNRSLANLLWVGFWVFVGISIAVLVWPSKPSSAPTTTENEPPSEQKQSGSDNLQSAAGRDAIAQSGSGPNIAAQGDGNHTINYYQPAGEPTDDRVWSRRTPTEIVEIYKNKTTFQADLDFQVHKGRWIRVRGAVSDYEGSLGSHVLYLRPEEKGGAFMFACFFPTDSGEAHLGDMNKGDMAVVEGQIQRASDIVLALENCRLVEG